MNNKVLIIILFLLFFIIFNTEKQNNTKRIQSKKKRNIKEIEQMKELSKKFIGKECLIYLMSGQMTGVITEVGDSAVIVEKDGVSEVVNLDFVVRIREYPKNKKGNKKKLLWINTPK